MYLLNVLRFCSQLILNKTAKSFQMFFFKTSVGESGSSVTVNTSILFSRLNSVDIKITEAVLTF